jgi:hypothetical protein
MIAVRDRVASLNKEKARPEPGSSVLPVIVRTVDAPLIHPRAIIVIIARVIVVTVARGIAVTGTVVAIVIGARCYGGT